MNRLFATAITLLLPVWAVAQSNVPPSVHAVLSGGYWQSGIEAGTYRVVVINTGWEHVTSRVFIEWVREPSGRDNLPVVVSSVEPELSFGQETASLNVTLKPLAKGKVQVVLVGVVSAQPSRKVKAVLVVTAPGRVATMAANPSIERTSTSGLRPLAAAAHVKR